jgi:hypothetical protein
MARHRDAGRAVVVVGVLVSACALAACGTALSSAPKSSLPHRALYLKTADTGWSYSLESMTTCHLTDALTVLRVAGTRPVHVEQIGVQYSNGGPFGVVAATFSFVALPPALADGYVGATRWSPTLRGGQVIRSASGATLAPTVASGRDYVLVLEMHVKSPVTESWGVRQLIVRYRAGHAQFTSRFAQRTSFPVSANCGEATPSARS